jgi:hypothetical protein
MSGSVEQGKCPVCQAGFRGAVNCSRCGADLSTLMLLVTHAYLLRQQARRCLRLGDLQTAQILAKTAQDLYTTPQGSLLRLACAAMNPMSK